MVGPGAPCAVTRQFLGDRLSTLVVETHSVDDCAVSGDAEEAWCRVARLWFPGHASQFGEAKAKPWPQRNCLGVLIQASGQAYGIWKLQTEEFDGKRGGVKKCASETSSQGISCARLQDAERPLMRCLSILGEQQGTDSVIKPGHEGITKLAAIPNQFQYKRKARP